MICSVIACISFPKSLAFLKCLLNRNGSLGVNANDFHSTVAHKLFRIFILSFTMLVTGRLGQRALHFSSVKC